MYLPAHVIPGLVGFISTPVLTKLFLPEVFGDYSLATATVLVMTALSGWLPMSIIRFYPSYERSRELSVFHGSVGLLSLLSVAVLTLVSCVALLAAGSLLHPRLYRLLAVGAGVFAFTAVFEVPQHVLRSRRQIAWYSSFFVWRSVAGFVLGLVFVLVFRLGIEGLLWGVMASMALVLPALWKTAIGGEAALDLRRTAALARQMAIYSLPLVVVNLASWVLRLSDRYILQIFCGSRDVGVYAASYNISDNTLMLFVSLFMLASGPLLMRAWEEGGAERAAPLLSAVTRFYLLACVPAAAGLAALAKPLVALLTDAPYHEGYPVVGFVVTAVLLMGLHQRFQMGFLFHKKTVPVTVMIVISGALNVVLNYLLVPAYGYMAAAVTTLISYACLLVLAVGFSRRLLAWAFPFRALRNSVLASLGMASAVLLFTRCCPLPPGLQVAAGVVLGGGVYATLLLMLGEFRPADVALVKAAVLSRLPGGGSPSSRRK